MIEGTEVIELATGLDAPKGVACDEDGAVYVAESGSGRVVKVDSSGKNVVIDGLRAPEGICYSSGKLYIVDSAAKTLTEYCCRSGKTATIATNIPVGSPPGFGPVKCGGVGNFSGPAGPFAAIAAGPNGALYVSADAEGSLIVLRREHG
jgi:DNA-binding beta-propeller fold protein YncE